MRKAIDHSLPPLFPFLLPPFKVSANGRAPSQHAKPSIETTQKMSRHAADVQEFLTIATGAILCARGVYSEQFFQRKRYRHISVQVCQQQELSEYIRTAVERCVPLILGGQLSKFVVAIKKRSGEVLESYGFSFLHAKDDGSSQASEDVDNKPLEETQVKALLKINRLREELDSLSGELCFRIYYAATDDAKCSAKLSDCDASAAEVAEGGRQRVQVRPIHTAEFSTVHLALQVTF